MTKPRLPTKAWLERTFPVKLVASWIAAAALLTFAPSLIPNPAYDRAGLTNLRYRCPMTVITQERSDLELQSYLVFVS